MNIKSDENRKKNFIGFRALEEEREEILKICLTTGETISQLIRRLISEAKSKNK